jgi:ribosomal protein S18
MRSQIRKKFMIKSIKKSDIEWKNLPLLIKFLNEGGKLMNRYQTRLPTGVHRKLARTVKHARNMGLLPFTDYIRPTDKLPLTNMYNEFVEDTAKVVDKFSGKIKVIHIDHNQNKQNQTDVINQQDRFRTQMLNEYTFNGHNSSISANRLAKDS